MTITAKQRKDDAAYAATLTFWDLVAEGDRLIKEIPVSTDPKVKAISAYLGTDEGEKELNDQEAQIAEAERRERRRSSRRRKPDPPPTKRRTP
jgi:hypothetical protein